VGDGVGLGVAEWVAFGVGEEVGVGDGVGVTGGSVTIGFGVGEDVGDGLSADAGLPVTRTAIVVAASSAAARRAGSIHAGYE
jgi:hypothetical protein